MVVGPTLDQPDITPKYKLGTKYQDDAGINYQYVYVDDDVDVVDGMVLVKADETASKHAVTPDVAGGHSLINTAATPDLRIVSGIAICDADLTKDDATQEERYMWIQLDGRVENLITDGGVSASNGLVSHLTADGQADTNTIGTDDWGVFGIALAADDTSSPSRVVAQVWCRGA